MSERDFDFQNSQMGHILSCMSVTGRQFDQENKKSKNIYTVDDRETALESPTDH